MLLGRVCSTPYHLRSHILNMVKWCLEKNNYFTSVSKAMCSCFVLFCFDCFSPHRLFALSLLSPDTPVDGWWSSWSVMKVGHSVSVPRPRVSPQHWYCWKETRGDRLIGRWLLHVTWQGDWICGLAFLPNGVAELKMLLPLFCHSF